MKQWSMCVNVLLMFVCTTLSCICIFFFLCSLFVHRVLLCWFPVDEVRISLIYACWFFCASGGGTLAG